MENFYSSFFLGADNNVNNGGAQKKVNVVDEHTRNLTAMEDQQWDLVAKKLAFDNHMRAKPDQQNGSHLPYSKYPILHHNNKPCVAGQNKGMKNPASKNKHRGSSVAQNDMVNRMIDKLLTLDIKSDFGASQKGILSHASPVSHTNVHNLVQTTSSPTSALDKRFKSLPPAESLPHNETLGGYIFVCNNDTMQEDLKRQLFGLPQRYRNSVRAIQPGLPLFLYNYTTHQLHGIYEAASFGGSNIDATAWEDKKNKGESRFPAQVRIRARKVCKPLEEDAFRPVLFHYDGPKFRLQLSIPETLALMDLLSENR